MHSSLFFCRVLNNYAQIIAIFTNLLRRKLKMKKLRKILTVALAAAMVTGAAVLPASATVYTDQELAKVCSADR